MLTLLFYIKERNQTTTINADGIKITELFYIKERNQTTTKVQPI